MKSDKNSKRRKIDCPKIPPSTHAANSKKLLTPQSDSDSSNSDFDMEKSKLPVSKYKKTTVSSVDNPQKKKTSSRCKKAKTKISGNAMKSGTDSISARNKIDSPNPAPSATNSSRQMKKKADDSTDSDPDGLPSKFTMKKHVNSNASVSGHKKSLLSKPVPFATKLYVKKKPHLIAKKRQFDPTDSDSEDESEQLPMKKHVNPSVSAYGCKKSLLSKPGPSAIKLYVKKKPHLIAKKREFDPTDSASEEKAQEPPKKQISGTSVAKQPPAPRPSYGEPICPFKKKSDNYESSNDEELEIIEIESPDDEQANKEVEIVTFESDSEDEEFSPKTDSSQPDSSQPDSSAEVKMEIKQEDDEQEGEGGAEELQVENAAQQEESSIEEEETIQSHHEMPPISAPVTSNQLQAAPPLMSFYPQMMPCYLMPYPEYRPHKPPAQRPSPQTIQQRKNPQPKPTQQRAARSKPPKISVFQATKSHSQQTESNSVLLSEGQAQQVVTTVAEIHQPPVSNTTESLPPSSEKVEADHESSDKNVNFDITDEQKENRNK